VQPDPLALLRSRADVRLLVLAALIGVPVSAAAYGFLKLVAWLQETLFTDLPGARSPAACGTPHGPAHAGARRADRRARDRVRRGDGPRRLERLPGLELVPAVAMGSAPCAP
jgi:hypothetical protein